jgi:hypothetical protein
MSPCRTFARQLARRLAPQPAPRLARSLRPLALAAAALATSLPAAAGLVARDLDGDTRTAEAYFDTTLGITWLRDTDLLASSYGLATAMSYAAATAALAAFNADSALNFGFSGWRLPGASGVHTLGGAGCQFGFNGSTDCGDNVDTDSSELASMFHDTLGNLSGRETTGLPRAGSAGVDFGLVDTADFTDLAAVGYWSGTTSYRLIFGLPLHGQVVFNLGTGTQGIQAATSLNAAWLVHDGDIGGAVVPTAGAVPLPGSLGLAALGLALLARRRTATA